MSKEHKKIHNSLMKSQNAIMNKMSKIEMDLHKHHEMHGGAIGFVDAFKKLGNTIKSGFEKKIIEPIKHSEELDYITKKKGGLASSLLHNALPATTSALVGGVTGLATGNPFLGMAGSATGGYAGRELADHIGSKTGVGLKGKGKRRKKYYYSSSSSSDSDGDFRPKRRTNNSALQQLLVANKDKEEKELKKSQLLINRHLAEEVKAVRGMRGPPQKFTGYGIKKIVGTKRGNRARGDIVAEVMKKEGLSLSQASKYVKEHDMY